MLSFRNMGVIAIVLWGTTGCTPNHDNGSGNLSSIDAGASAVCTQILKTEFVRAYAGFLRTNCGACHASGGPGSGFFADANPDIAFPAFQIKGESKIAMFSTSTHKPPYTGTQHQTMVTSLSTSWRTADSAYLACVQNQSGTGTNPMPQLATTPNRFTVMKSANPQNNQTVKLTWNLANEMAQAAQAYPATFSIDVQAFTNGGLTGYQFKNPVLQNDGTVAAYVRGIGVRVNGQDIPGGTTFYAIRRYVPALDNNDTRSLAATGAIVMQSAIDQAINVEVGFTELKNSDIDFRPVGFDELIATGGIFQSNCVSCHGAARQDGGFSIERYENIVGRVGATGLTLVSQFGLENSSIWTRMNSTAAPMPTGGLLAQAMRDRVRDWILDGAPRSQSAAVANTGCRSPNGYEMVNFVNGQPPGIPLCNSTIRGSVSLRLSPDDGVDRFTVDIFVDDVLINTENSPPYEWRGGTVNANDPANISLGAHTMRIVIKDNNGVVLETIPSIPFTVVN